MRWREIRSRVGASLHARLARRFSPVQRGLIEGVGITALGAVPMGLLLAWLSPPAPSADLLGALAEVGVVLVLAYVVEIVWLVPRLASKDDYESRLGGLTGAGIAGLIGVVLALALSAHRAAGHENLLDAFGTAWIVIAFGTLSGLVVMQPIIVHEWEIESKDGHRN